MSESAFARHRRQKVMRLLQRAPALAILLTAVIGCATTSNEIDLKKIAQKERIYFGRVYVNFNGNTHPRCELYVNSDLAPVLKIADDNLVFYKTDRESLRFSKIACYHESSMYYAAWHLHELNLSKIEKSDSNTAATYFGDLHLDWKIEEKDTVTSAESAPFEEVTPKRVGHVKDSGEIRISVDSKFEAAKGVVSSRAPSLVLTEKLITPEKN